MVRDPQQSDESLMAAVAANGDERAFSDLYSRYGTRLYRFFLRMLWGDKGRAEDMTQEIFLKIIERPHSFDVSRRFSTWIFAVATNLCKNEYRRKHPILVEDFQSEAWGDLSYDYKPEQIDEALYAQHLQAAIDQLDWPHRQCFVLRYQEELSLQEVSEVLGCPIGTVKSRSHYALKRVIATLTNWKNHA
jgi:RNA polymerase sigma-70 factor, ECF subfamily